MAQRMVRYSDVSNEVIDDDNAVVRIVVERHPALADGPVEIEVAQDEADALRMAELRVADLILHRNDGSEPEEVTVELGVFDGLAGNLDMAEILQQATPVSRPRRPSKPSGEKLDYGTLEHAGKPHRGKITDAEREIVRGNLVAVNDRLRSEGVRTIDLDNAEHVTRYDLEGLAKQSGQHR